MNWALLGVAIFFAALIVPALIAMCAAPFIDLRYGNVYLLGAFFEGNITREERPRLFWAIEIGTIFGAVLFAAKMVPFLIELFSGAIR